MRPLDALRSTRTLGGVELASAQVTVGAGRRGIASFPPALAENPYQRLLYGSLANLGVPLEQGARLRLAWLFSSRQRVAALHIHWPQGFYRHEGRGAATLSWLKLGLFASRLAAARVLGYRILWTVHQVYPHESTHRRLDRAAALLLGRLANALVAHDEGTLASIRAELPAAAGKTSVIAHGSYIGVYPAGRDRAAVRAELGISPGTFVFLAFGHVRAYKEIGLVLDGFRDARVEDAALVVAGLPLDAASAALVTARAGADPRIKPLLRFVPDGDVAELFGAADAAIVARGDGGTSGALILALSLGVPVVGADTPTYTTLLRGGEAGWLFRPGDARSLGLALEAAASDPAAARLKARTALSAAKDLSWQGAARRTASLVVVESR